MYWHCPCCDEVLFSIFSSCTVSVLCRYAQFVELAQLHLKVGQIATPSMHCTFGVPMGSEGGKAMQILMKVYVSCKWLEWQICSSSAEPIGPTNLWLVWSTPIGLLPDTYVANLGWGDMVESLWVVAETGWQVKSLLGVPGFQPLT